jgi:hypothetical protein
MCDHSLRLIPCLQVCWQGVPWNQSAPAVKRWTNWPELTKLRTADLVKSRGKITRDDSNKRIGIPTQIRRASASSSAGAGRDYPPGSAGIRADVSGALRLANGGCQAHPPNRRHKSGGDRRGCTGRDRAWTYRAQRTAQVKRPNLSGDGIHNNLGGEALGPSLRLPTRKSHSVASDPVLEQSARRHTHTPACDIIPR